MEISTKIKFSVINFESNSENACILEDFIAPYTDEELKSLGIEEISYKGDVFGDYFIYFTVTSMGEKIIKDILGGEEDLDFIEEDKEIVIISRKLSAMAMDKKGLSKLIEECEKLIRIAAIQKPNLGDDLCMTSMLKEKLEERIGDVLAAIDLVTDKFNLNRANIKQRSLLKSKKYQTWDEEK